MKTDPRLRNKSYKHKVKTIKKNIFSCFLTNTVDRAKALLLEFEQTLQSGVNKGIYHKNTAIRYISRMTHNFKVLSELNHAIVTSIKDQKTQEAQNAIKNLESRIVQQANIINTNKRSTSYDTYVQSLSK